MKDGACIMGVSYTRNNAGLVVVPHTLVRSCARVALAVSARLRGSRGPAPGRGWGGWERLFSIAFVLIISPRPALPFSEGVARRG